MKIKVSKSKAEGNIFIPGSKSHTIRALAAALMAKGTSTIRNPLVSDDTISCLYATQKLGAELSEISEDDVLVWKIKGTGGKLTNETDEIIDLGNSGTSLRLLTGLAATGDLKICFDGDNSLRGRPMGSLILALEKLGVKAGSSEEGKCPLAVRGPILGGETIINGKTSQFVTSLLFATPLAKQKTEINVINVNEKPYIEMTLEWLDYLGIKYNCTPDFSNFTIRGNQKYKTFEKTIPADFSTATFALAAAAVTGGKLKIYNLDFTDKQGDKEVFDYLERMGMRVKKSDSSVTVFRTGKLYGDIKIDLNSTPDALPAMAAVSCYAKGKTILSNVPHARFKETDRIAAMTKELMKMGADIIELKDGLVIKKSKLHGAKVNGYNDHRIIMALAIAGMGASGETIIKNAEAVSVTYPNFIKDFQKIGAEIEQI
jgi:3-phosphoshikimate 1-carboxyvinyltransferase